MLVARNIFVVTRHLDYDVVGHDGGAIVELDHLDVIRTVLDEIRRAEVFQNFFFRVQLGVSTDGDKIIYGGEAAGYVLKFEDFRSLYFSGDTAVFGDMELIQELYEPLLAFLPIGDLFTMGPRQAALACGMLRPQRVIPMHFGTFPILTGTPGQLSELLRDKGTEVWTLTPGQTVTW